MSYTLDATDFVTAARVLKAVEPELRKAMLKGVRQAATPLRNDLRAAVKATSANASSTNMTRALWVLSRYRGTNWERAGRSALRRSGLRDGVARSIRIVAKSSGFAGQAGVRISTSGQGLPPDQRTLPRRMNKGSWSHPVYGNRNAWVKQTVSPPGWWSSTARRSGPAAREGVKAAVREALVALRARLAQAT